MFFFECFFLNAFFECFFLNVFLLFVIVIFFFFDKKVQTGRKKVITYQEKHCICSMYTLLLTI